MNFEGLNRKDILDKLDEFHTKDMTYTSGRILGSMCTQPHPIAIEAYNKFLVTNLGDSGLFKGISIIEKDVINSLGNLLHLDNAAGHIVSGGTEANLMAMVVAKYLFEEKNHESTPELILPESAHFSFKKICSMLSVKPIYVPLTEEYKMDVSKLQDLINENTMAIVAIAGTTELGLIDDIEKISKIAYSNQVYLHVDAAFGGFIIPFLNYNNNDKINFDFKCEGVCSITLDPHKMGLAPIPSGGIIFRHEKYLEKLAVKTPYLTKKKQTTIIGTRSGASTAATWAVINHLGIEGYQKIVNNAMNLTNYTYNLLKKINHVNMVCEPELNLISFKVDNINVDTLQKRLSKNNWQVSVAENPHAIRIVLMPHVKKVHIDEFIRDLKNILEEIK